MFETSHKKPCWNLQMLTSWPKSFYSPTVVSTTDAAYIMITTVLVTVLSLPPKSMLKTIKIISITNNFWTCVCVYVLFNVVIQ